MATVPGILYISSYMGQGGLPALAFRNPSNSDLERFNERELLEFVPQNANGTQAATFTPWYDGLASDVYFPVDEAACTSTRIYFTGSPGWANNLWVGKVATLINTSGPFFLVYTATTNYPDLSGWITRKTHPGIIASGPDWIEFAGGIVTGMLPGTQVMFGIGRFTAYHAIPGRVNPYTGGGSSWQILGAGVGPDVEMVRGIAKRIYPTGFYFFKYCQNDSAAVGWASGGAARTNLLAELEKVAAAAAFQGNVIQWQLAIVDVHDVDMEQIAADVPGTILSHYTNYKANITNLVAWLRGSAVLNNNNLPYSFVANANIHAQLTNHGPDLWNVAPTVGLAADWRGKNFELANGEISRLGLIEMADARYAPAEVEPNGGNTLTVRKFYSFPSVLEFGRRSVTLFERQLAGIPAAAPSTGFPLYFLIGDSIAKGNINSLWTDNTDSLTLIGPDATGVKPEGEYIFNALNNSFERYNPNANSNTSGTVDAFAGPEMSMVAELAKIHPAGFGLVKRALNGSTLVRNAGAGLRWVKSAAENYNSLLSLAASAKSFVNEIYGKQADVRGIHVSLGHNDAASGADGAAFAAALPTFVSNLRQDLTARTSGKGFPITWRKPQAAASGANPAAISAIHTGLSSQARIDSQFRVVDVDDLERVRSLPGFPDDIHETPESAVIHGRRAVAALVAISI